MPLLNARSSLGPDFEAVSYGKKILVFDKKKKKSADDDDVDEAKVTLLKPLDGHDKYGVRCLAVSPCGKMIASAGDDGNRILVHSSETGELVETIPAPTSSSSSSSKYHSGAIFSLCFTFSSSLPSNHHHREDGVEKNSRGLLLASASIDKTVRIWSMESKKCVRVISGGLHSNIITCVRSSPAKSVEEGAGGEFLATSSWDKTACIVRLCCGNTNGDADDDDDVENASFCRLRGHTNFVNSVAWSPVVRSNDSGYLLATASSDRSIRLWRFNPSATATATASISKSAKQEQKQQQQQQQSGDTTTRMTANNVGEISARQVLTGHDDTVASVTFSPMTGSLLASSSYDSTVRLWKRNQEDDNDRFEPLKVLRDHRRGWVLSVCFSPNERLLASVGGDARSILVHGIPATLWQQHQHQQHQHQQPTALVCQPIKMLPPVGDLTSSSSALLNAVVFSPSGQSLLCSSDTKSEFNLCIFNVAVGRPLREFAHHHHHDGFCCDDSSKSASLLSFSCESNVARIVWLGKLPTTANRGEAAFEAVDVDGNSKTWKWSELLPLEQQQEEEVIGGVVDVVDEKKNKNKNNESATLLEPLAHEAPVSVVEEKAPPPPSPPSSKRDDTVVVPHDVVAVVGSEPLSKKQEEDNSVQVSSDGKWKDHNTDASQQRSEAAEATPEATSSGSSSSTTVSRWLLLGLAVLVGAGAAVAWQRKKRRW